MALVKFIQGKFAQYNALEPKDQDTLYFITDQQKIYKGDKLFSGGVYTAVAEFPPAGELNTLYVNTKDGSVKYWNGVAYQEVVKPNVNAIDGSGDELHLPTTKAVVNYVTQAVADVDLSAVTKRIDTIDGKLAVIEGEGEGSIKKALVDAKAYTDELANGQVNTNKVAIEALQSGKADKAASLAGYGIDDAYTKLETDAAIKREIGKADHLKRTIVSVLPEVEAADEHTIYMVKKSTGTGDKQQYDEYMLIVSGDIKTFEKIGDSAVDLTDYALKSEVSIAKQEAIDAAGANADAKILAAVQALDVEDVAVENQYVSQVVETDGKIAITRAELPVKSVTEGSENGTIAVNGSNVNVHGLGSAAYVGTETFATAAQGGKADSAVQKEQITTGSGQGTIAVQGSEVAVSGLKSAAFVDVNTFATAAQGEKAEQALAAMTWGTL